MKYVPTTTKRDLRILGEQFSQQRKLLMLTVADVAHRSGVSPTTVSNLEQGKAVRSDSLLTIARVLQLADTLVAACDPYSTDLGVSALANNSRSAFGGESLMAKTIESTVLITLGPGMEAPAGTLYATGDDLSFRYDSTYTISSDSFDLFPSMPRSLAVVDDFVLACR